MAPDKRQGCFRKLSLWSTSLQYQLDIYLINMGTVQTQKFLLKSNFVLGRSLFCNHYGIYTVHDDLVPKRTRNLKFFLPLEEAYIVQQPSPRYGCVISNNPLLLYIVWRACTTSTPVEVYVFIVFPKCLADFWAFFTFYTIPM